MAFRYGSVNFPIGFWQALGGGEEIDGTARTMVSRRQGGNIIPYEDEDPAIRKMFNEAPARNGIKPWEP